MREYPKNRHRLQARPRHEMQDPGHAACGAAAKGKGVNMTVVSAGKIKLHNAKTRERTGSIDICADDEGNIHMCVTRVGGQLVIRMKPDVALKVAGVLCDAAEALK